MFRSLHPGQLRLLLELDSDLNLVQDLDLLLEEILTKARHSVNADEGSILLVEDGHLHIRYIQNGTLQRALPPGQHLAYEIFSIDFTEKSIPGYCALTGKLLNIRDSYRIEEDAPYRLDHRFDSLVKYETHSSLTLPLKTNSGEVVGVLQLVNALDRRRRVHPFSLSDERLATHFSAIATLALQRAQLTRTMILRMTAMAELRDPKETGPHVNRVAGYSTVIYQRWAEIHGIDSATAHHLSDQFRMAAMLHDVGKVGIDDAILKKPGPLTADEYRIMKTHTMIGSGLFQSSHSEFDQMAKTVALTHHERWDGTGYPSGISGLKIPIWGRITAVADVYDALSCHRVYKAAWPQERVLTELNAQKGYHFDPEVVEILFEVLPALGRIFARYPEAEST